MTLLSWEIASVRVTGLSRDTFTMGNIHGYVKKSKETAHGRFHGKIVNWFVEINRETMGAFHLRKKPGNFGGSKSGISDW